MNSPEFEYLPDPVVPGSELSMQIDRMFAAAGFNSNGIKSGTGTALENIIKNDPNHGKDWRDLDLSNLDMFWGVQAAIKADRQWAQHIADSLWPEFHKAADDVPRPMSVPVVPTTENSLSKRLRGERDEASKRRVRASGERKTVESGQGHIAQAVVKSFTGRQLEEVGELKPEIYQS